jgi:probable selenium-dependent hydroxylase accessory protein YqeC
LALVEAKARRARRISFAAPIDKPGRLGGIPFELVRDIHEAVGFDVTLIKADGARMRLIKAPAEHEPPVPAFATTVIPLVSAMAIGQALDDRIAHRPERIAALSGAEPRAPLRPEHVARLIASPQGLLRNIPAAAAVVPVINMVDDAGLLAAAVETAERALMLSARFERIVLARMIGDEPVVRVVERFGTR